MHTLRRLLCESDWSMDISDFRQTEGMDPGSSLLTFPSMWNNLLKQSSLKCFEPWTGLYDWHFFGVSKSLVCWRPMQGNSSCRIRWVTTALENTAAHNVARTRRKQQLLNSFSQIKIHIFFSKKTSTLHTELATFLVFRLWLWRCDYDVSIQSSFQTRTFFNSSNGGRFEREVTVIT